MRKQYVVATVGKWHIDAFHRYIEHVLPGWWTIVTRPSALTLELLEIAKPTYVFFPQWRERVPDEIVNRYECVCFHETDLPYGRGGTPIQNLIVNGRTETVVSAIRMTPEIDAGPVYMKQPLCLQGSAEEIFIRSAEVIASMIKSMVCGLRMMEPTPQSGEVTMFERRAPWQSACPRVGSLSCLFDHIRMLDAEGYPQAFIDWGPFRIHFSRAALKVGGVEADARIEIRE